MLPGQPPSDRPLRQLPVLIIGGGIAGLVLAQSLKKRGIPFIVFERDDAPNSRLQGWALTIHFALPQLLEMLPDELHDKLDQVQVNPTLRYDQSYSTFLNLANCDVKWRLPPSAVTRKRVSRDRFRLMLLADLKDQILWGKQFVSFHAQDEVTVTATFSDGSSYTGLLLVGAEGSRSKVRSLLYNMTLNPPSRVPISFLGTSLDANGRQIRSLLELDPVLFQGCHPVTKTWMWFSVMDSPQTNGTAELPEEKQMWRIQLCLSWPTESSTDIPATDAERVLKMRERAECFHPMLRALLTEALPDNHGPILSIDLQDWYLPASPSLNNLGGRVTVAGDAAHTMAMYRGEGFNHALLDDYHLTMAIEKVYDSTAPSTTGDISALRTSAIATYEENVRRRGTGAVGMCRAATLEVHDYDKLSEQSIVRQKTIL
ncbi:hypothetical protein BDV30DRAFT_233011 [Aspergillus minisclerotigenes]|uniref:FAD-binding domain-containing protein n=1 Tax=Aspergillus minisclerotigenes TaxID=656917 RepID=A0A5N6JMH5_9EURO|nr:hypothetical protein BDV30DRAFT_233011 [Aspergillus minisclerotigenes]